MKTNQILLFAFLAIGCVLLLAQRVFSSVISPMTDVLLIGGAVFCILIALLISQNIHPKGQDTGASDENK